jgi:hypothetical protein
MADKRWLAAVAALVCFVMLVSPHVVPALQISYPQLVCRTPQSQGKYCDQNRGQSCHGTVILASRDAGAGDMQFQPNDRFDEQGAFFVKGLIGLVVLALVYAALKRF